MTEETKETVEIDGKKYIVEDLTEKQKYWINQVKDCKNRASMFRMQVDQMEMAANSFIKNLIEDLETEKKEEGNE